VIHGPVISRPQRRTGSALDSFRSRLNSERLAAGVVKRFRITGSGLWAAWRRHGPHGCIWAVSGPHANDPIRGCRPRGIRTAGYNAVTLKQLASRLSTFTSSSWTRWPIDSKAEGTSGSMRDLTLSNCVKTLNCRLDNGGLECV
jgi:hypothetical protein